MIELTTEFASHPNQIFRKAFAHSDISLSIIAFCFNQFPTNLNIVTTAINARFLVDDKRGCQVSFEEGVVEVTLFFGHFRL
jgi:hypothetical protein